MVQGQGYVSQYMNTWRKQRREKGKWMRERGYRGRAWTSMESGLEKNVMETARGSIFRTHTAEGEVREWQAGRYCICDNHTRTPCHNELMPYQDHNAGGGPALDHWPLFVAPEGMSVIPGLWLQSKWKCQKNKAQNGPTWLIKYNPNHRKP